MSSDQHFRRARILTQYQHPFVHSVSDFSYMSDQLPGVTNVQTALDYLIAVLYPQSQPAVADPASLPLVGNSIGDMRVVQDDGDGKAASYRWEQREGDVAAQWYKIYDLDWGTDSILQGYLLKTQDIYVHRLGYDDLDETGTPLAGVDAGQHIYGGASANTHLTLHANSGDGVGPQTGFIQVADEVRPQVDSTWSLGTTSERWLKIWTDEITTSTMTLLGGSITDSSGAISFGDENLSTTGNVTGAVITGSTSGVFASDITITSGSIISASGDITFGDENLTTTGIITGGTGRFGAANDIVITTGSITSVSGTINFGDEILTTTGNITGAVLTGTQLNIDNVRLDGNTVSITDLDGNLNLNANGTGIVAVGNAMTTGDITATGTVTVTGQLNPDNLRLDGNTLSSTDSNGNIVFEPDGTGIIQTGATLNPVSDDADALGAAGNRYTTLFLSTSISDGTNSIPQATLLSFRDANVGVNTGDALFWDGSKWVASNPDTEIDHGELSGLADDDHSQYALLAGRSGGQTLIGGIDPSDNLLLQSTSDATRGIVAFADVPAPNTTASYTVSWAGTDIGSSSKTWRHVYTAGEFFGFRLENLGADPAASTQRIGRLFWHTADEAVKVDTGTAILRIGAKVFLSDTVWNGTDTTKDVSVTTTGMDARIALWQLKDNANDFEVMHVSLKAIDSTTVRITVNLALPAGTYRLYGVQ